MQRLYILLGEYLPLNLIIIQEMNNFTSADRIESDLHFPLPTPDQCK